MGRDAGISFMAVIGERVLRRVDRGLVQGRIDATLPDGRAVVLGARAEGPAVIVMLHRWRALRRLASGGSA
ncbi:MAG: SAM-dependent methyltransferase, partial [Pseudomonadota bacterium]|nr:SAM-dependent methyltransferase [Pseudomonadota bacterium]